MESGVGGCLCSMGKQSSEQVDRCGESLTTYHKALRQVVSVQFDLGV